MFLRFFIALLILVGCNTNKQTTPESADKDSVVQKDTPVNNSPVASPKIYSNQRFREVTVEKTGDHSFLIKGQGQIFEASFGWVIEDGHNELKQGFSTTDMGAPEWGNFSFTVDAEKKNPNSTLHIVLFETSAKDGSRQHELPLLLY